MLIPDRFFIKTAKFSIPAQVRRLKEYAERKKLTVDKVFQVTESSTKETRKQFNEIIALIRKSREPVALITDTVDRLQRSFRETPTLDELRKEGKLELHFLRESLIVNSEANSAQLLQWDIAVLFAPSYVRQLSDNVKRSKEQSVRNGEWITGAPFGYRNLTLVTGKKTIEVEPHEAPFVQKMFEMYVSGIHSFKTIADEMTKLGVRNKNGNEFLPGRVHFILTNPFYYGLMKVKGELYPHKYPLLVTDELFQRVQSVMAGYCKAPVHYAAKPILLRGMITCSHCGSTISGEIK
jgi:site-specific DNA recombinase